MELQILTSSRTGHNFVRANVESWFGDKITSYRNFENSPPKELPDLPGLKIVVVRHYLNWVASLIKSAENRPTYDWASVMRLYIPIGEEYFHPKYFKAHGRIYYDDFIKSKDYRECICNLIGGKFNDDMIDYVPANGGASSFDGHSLDGNGTLLPTDQRWRQILWSGLRGDYISALRSFKHNAKYFMNNFETTKEEDKFIINNVLS